MLVVDHHPVIGNAIAKVLREQEDLHYAGQAHTATEALRRIEQTRPDVVVLDLSLPDAYGLDLAGYLVSQYPNLQILIFSMYSDAIFAERALGQGAIGYLMKSASPSELCIALRSVASGYSYLNPGLAAQLFKQALPNHKPRKKEAFEQLSPRELATLLMVAEGVSPQEMADRLNLDRKTVETHRRRLKEKLGFDSVSSLLHFATEWRHRQGNLKPANFQDEARRLKAVVGVNVS